MQQKMLGTSGTLANNQWECGQGLRHSENTGMALGSSDNLRRPQAQWEPVKDTSEKQEGPTPKWQPGKALGYHW